MTEWDKDRQRRFWEALEVSLKHDWTNEVHGYRINDCICARCGISDWPPSNASSLCLLRLTLDNLFKYAVPKLMEQGYTIMCESVKEGISVLYEWCFTRGENEGIWQALDKDPALALAEAIEKVIVI